MENSTGISIDPLTNYNLSNKDSIDGYIDKIIKTYEKHPSIKIIKEHFTNLAPFTIPTPEISDIEQILKEINCIGKPTIMVFNKIDMYKEIPWDENELIQKRNKKNYTLEEWKKTWISKKNEQSVFISALKKKNVIELQSIIYQNVRKIHVTRFPYNHFLYPEKIN